MQKSCYHKTTAGVIHYIRRKGYGVTIVAIHGVGSNHTVWKKALSGFKNPLVMVDLHGHGKTTNPWTSMNIIVRDIRDVLAKEKIRRPILIGNSLGSSIAVMLSKHVKIEKLILIGPFFYDVIHKVKYIRPMLSALSKVSVQNPLRKFVDYSKEKARNSMLYPFIDLQGTSFSTWMAGAAATMEVRLADVSKKTPTLVIFGTKDRYLAQGFLEHQLKDINASAIGIDCDHLVLYHKPKEISNILKSFLSR